MEREVIQQRRAPMQIWPAKALLRWARGYHELGTVERGDRARFRLTSWTDTSGHLDARG